MQSYETLIAAPRGTAAGTLGDGAAEQGGFVLMLLVVVLAPMLLMVGAFSVAMTGRSGQLRVELDQERALLAAEAGVDDAIHTAQIMAMYDGLTYTRALGGGLSFKVAATHLLADGIDNDGDMPPLIDESPDEDVYQVIVSGSYRESQRRIAAYLGPVPLMPPIGAAVGTMSPTPTIILNGSPLASGNNVKMNGTPAAGGDLPGMSIAPPGTTADLLAELDPSEQVLVQGTGGTPSLGTMPAFDIDELVTQLANAANIVLTADKYTSYDFGNGIAGETNIAYREGDLEFAGTCQGAGILVVTGDMKFKGNFRFDGIIIVLGNIEQSSGGTVDIYGGIVQGPAASTIEIHGSMEVHYCSAAISQANAGAMRYVAFNGWQELSQ